MAVAVGDGTVGSAQIYTNSQADIVLTPNVPVNIYPNDEISVSLGIENYIENSGKDAEIKVTANLSNNLKLIGEKSVSEKTHDLPMTILVSLIAILALCVVLLRMKR